MMKKINLLVAVILLSIFSCKDAPPVTEKDENATTDSLKTEIEGIVNEELEKVIDPVALIESKDEAELNTVQKTIQDLLLYCSEGKNTDASKLILYQGDDASRMFQDHFDYSVANEKSTVDATCSVIKSWLEMSASYEFITYTTETRDNGLEYHSAEVLFQEKEIGVSRRFFDFIESEKGYLLIGLR